MTRQVKICYYTSGHGFGHATRAAQLASSLLSLGASVSLVTLAPRHLFPHHEHIAYRTREVDSSIVQPLPYDIDVPSSFLDLQRFFGHDRTRLKGWVHSETAYIHAEAFNLVLADAPWAVGLLQTAIPRIVVSNFTFDLIFQDLLHHLPQGTDSGIKAEYQALVEDVVKAYQGFKYLIRLPGFIDFPFLQQDNNETRVLNAPLVFRPAKTSREETLGRLNIPREYWNCKVLLVQFGGHLVTASDAAPQIPEDWICLLATPVPHPHFFTFEPSEYLPDLVEASDVVLGKIGYGTVSECVGMAKPLLYVARDMFAEEPYLLQYMAANGTCLELDRDDFEHGRWSEPVCRVFDLASAGIKRQPLQDGSQALAKTILDLIE